MGVWIETGALESLNILLKVTPCMGVWIETWLVTRTILRI